MMLRALIEWWNSRHTRRKPKPYSRRIERRERGVGHSVPIPNGEQDGDGEPSKTFVMPDEPTSWDEIERELNGYE